MQWRYQQLWQKKTLLVNIGTDLKIKAFEKFIKLKNWPLNSPFLKFPGKKVFLNCLIEPPEKPQTDFGFFHKS